MTSIAVIPARGGSKRIPRKNVRLFHGQPAIARSIQTALNSDCFDRVIVSTDDREIADIARQHGAEIPFMRPDSLADDYTTTQAVIRHSIEALDLQDSCDASICCIYPVTPFLKGSRIKEGLQLLLNSEYEFVASVMDYDYPVQRALRIEASHIEMIQGENLVVRTQDLDEIVHDAGQFYWGWSTSWLADAPIFQAATGAIKLDRTEAVDIDTEADWRWSEALFDYQTRAQSCYRFG